MQNTKSIDHSVGGKQGNTGTTEQVCINQTAAEARKTLAVRCGWSGVASRRWLTTLNIMRDKKIPHADTMSLYFASLTKVRLLIVLSINVAQLGYKGGSPGSPVKLSQTIPRIVARQPVRSAALGCR